MAGEYIQSDTIKDYWKQLKAYYEAASPYYKEIDKKKYDSFERSEREDSDNQKNQFYPVSSSIRKSRLNLYSFTAKNCYKVPCIVSLLLIGNR